MVKGNRARMRTAAFAVGLVACMTGLAYASVPLYELFCQITGYGGTPGRLASTAPAGGSEADAQAVAVKPVTIRFNVDTEPGLAWQFSPPEPMEWRTGEPVTAIYRVRNDSDQVSYGTSTYNVTPHKAGPFVIKAECFCFTEQKLEPGEEADMQVTFLVDPGMALDKDTQEVGTVTLSYSFYETDGTEWNEANASQSGGHDHSAHNHNAHDHGAHQSHASQPVDHSKH